MPLHLLIAPDSFKACLSASAVAQAMAEGVRSVMPDAKISRCPLSDGGEGLTDVLAARRPHIIIYKENNIIMYRKDSIHFLHAMPMFKFTG